MQSKKSASGRKPSKREADTGGDLFAVFDRYGNHRITREDLRRISDDLGFDYSREELSDMIRFWDSTGTLTLSEDDFRRVVQEAGLKGARSSS